MGLEAEFHILAVDYNGQYAGSEMPFTSRRGEAEEIIRYLREYAISSVALVYGQSMGGEMGMELISQMQKGGIAIGAAFFDGHTENSEDREARVFTQAVLGKGELVVKAEQAYVVTQILEGIYESAKTGKPFYFKKQKAAKK